jgi:opacity protein-like surface antigen
MVGLLLCLGSAVAQAQYYYYLPEGAGPIFRVGIGPSFFQDGQLTQYGTSVSSPVDYDTGLAFDAAFGWAFNKYVAVDFETGYIGAEINNVPGYISDNSRIENVPFLVNFTLSYSIPRTILVPYAGVGIGGADMIFDSDHFGPSSDPGNYVSGSENDVVFAGQAFAGLRFNISRHVSFDLGYKFFATDNPTFTYPPDSFNVGFRGARTHSILFAFKFDF